MGLGAVGDRERRLLATPPRVQALGSEILPAKGFFFSSLPCFVGHHRVSSHLPLSIHLSLCPSLGPSRSGWLFCVCGCVLFCVVDFLYCHLGRMPRCYDTSIPTSQTFFLQVQGGITQAKGADVASCLAAS